MRGYSPRLILGKQIHPLFSEHIEAVRKSPGFYSAMRAEADWIVQQYTNSDDPYYGKSMGDVANMLMESATVYFHLLKKYENSGAGATLGKLQMVAFVHGFASPRRVTMYVKSLVQEGVLGYSDQSNDRRIRRLVPCEPMMATSRQHMLGLLKAARIVWPEELSPAHGVALPPFGVDGWSEDERTYFDLLILETGHRYLEGADPLRPFSDVRHFTSKDAGSFLLYEIVRSSMDANDVPNPDVRFALMYSETSAKAGVSRTHVRNVIEGAQQRGLITDLEEGGRSMRLTDKFVAAFEAYFASLLILTRVAAIAAARRTKQLS